MLVLLVLILMATLATPLVEGKSLNFADQKRIALYRKNVLPLLAHDSEFLALLPLLDTQSILKPLSNGTAFGFEKTSIGCISRLENLFEEYQKGNDWAIRSEFNIFRPLCSVI
jgi:hypothetical protein